MEMSNKEQRKDIKQNNSISFKRIVKIKIQSLFVQNFVK